MLDNRARRAVNKLEATKSREVQKERRHRSHLSRKKRMGRTLWKKGHDVLPRFCAPSQSTEKVGTRVLGMLHGKRRNASYASCGCVPMLGRQCFLHGWKRQPRTEAFVFELLPLFGGSPIQSCPRRYPRCLGQAPSVWQASPCQVARGNLARAYGSLVV